MLAIFNNRARIVMLHKITKKKEKIRIMMRMIIIVRIIRFSKSVPLKQNIELQMQILFDNREL